MNVKECTICGNSTNNSLYEVKEMMFGYRDKFEYLKCSQCGCLQITEIPQNIEKYYPTDYYSFAEINRDRTLKKIKIAIKKQIIEYKLCRKNLIGLIFSRFFNNYYWITKGICNYDSKILDIGCGNGNLLLDLNELGFKKLSGIDPYLRSDIYYENHVKVYKKEIKDLNEKYDLIIFNHSFEHIQNPKEVLQKIHKCLNPQSYVLIFIPVVSGYAFRKYGINWVQLDAPRHLFLHTPTSINILAQETGFEVTESIYDSTIFQFTGSERYENGKSLFEDYEFTKDQLKFYKKEAIRLNRINNGDSAVFYLQKV